MPPGPAPVLAIDLGGTKLLAALVDGARVIDRAEAATDRDAGAQAWVARMAALAAPWRGRFARAGITVTGRVQGGLWSALNPGTLAIPEGFPLGAAATEALGVPVTLCNDAQAAAWGEHVHGAGQGRDCVFLTVSTGIGGGVVAGGRLLTGRSGLAGSFGQVRGMPDGPDGDLFEDRASGRWIAAEAARQGHAVDAAAVTAAAQAGAPWADAILNASATRIARLCRNLQLAFDPQVIVIGGGVGLSAGYLDRVAAGLAPLDAVFRPTLVRAALGAHSGAIGIAALTTRNQDNREETP